MSTILCSKGMISMQENVYVALTFDLDGETLWTSRDKENAKRPVALSHGAYGPKVGLERIIKLLDQFSIKSTFFIPGWIIEQYPKEVGGIVEQKHEIGHHGYLHEYPDTLSPEEERSILTKGIDIIETLTGKKPSGYRSPAWEFSMETLYLLKEMNFLYSSNMMDNDEPYIHENGIAEMPVQWLMDDAPFSMFHPRVPGRSIQSTAAVFTMWKEEFSALYEEGKPTILTFHPQFIGRPHRVKHLKEFIEFVLEHPNVRFVTLEELAQLTIRSTETDR